MTTYTEAEILEHRALWTSALRSGEYGQIAGQLRLDEDKALNEEEWIDFINGDLTIPALGYCCLGVACEVAALSGVEDSDYEGSDGAPADSVRRWLGLDELYSTGVTVVLGQDEHGFTCIVDEDSDASRPNRGHESVSLMELNDSYGYTFNDIADVIDGGLVEVVL